MQGSKGGWSKWKKITINDVDIGHVDHFEDLEAYVSKEGSTIILVHVVNLNSRLIKNKDSFHRVKEYM